MMTNRRVTVRSCVFAHMSKPDPQERCTSQSSSSALMGKDDIRNCVKTPSFAPSDPHFRCHEIRQRREKNNLFTSVLPLARELCCVDCIWAVICTRTLMASHDSSRCPGESKWKWVSASAWMVSTPYALPSILAVPDAVSVASATSWLCNRSVHFGTGNPHDQPRPSRGFLLTGELFTMALHGCLSTHYPAWCASEITNALHGFSCACLLQSWQCRRSSNGSRGSP